MQKNPLAHKVALVTGAAKRIGAEISKTLHEAGMNVVLHYNASEDAVVTLCDELNAKRKNSAIAMRADLQEAESEKSLVVRATAAWGRLDALINNASRFYRTTFGEVTEYAWNDLMNSNTKAPFFLAQAAADILAEYQGVIVNVTDIHADRPLMDYSVYCISKSALWMVTKVLAKELGPSVRVNAVAPGPILWPEGENTLLEAEKKRIIEKTILKRSGDPQDIAKAVLFLVRDAGYMTGQMLSIDGGRMLSG